MNKKWLILPGLVALLALVIGGAFYYYEQTHNELKGIVGSNGRIEAQTVDIATRTSARVIDSVVQEGDMVESGAIVMRLDLNALSASLSGAEANVRYSQQEHQSTIAKISAAESAQNLAQKNLERSTILLREGHIAQARFDQTLNNQQAAESALNITRQQLSGTAELVSVAEAEVARLQELLRDQELRSPLAGRVLYRLAEPGEVVAAGARVMTLIDLSDVYMTVFLSASDISQIHLRDEARIMVDALPDTPIPAYVSYISPEAQFTPRQVETRTERDKLTFRVKVRIPASLLTQHQQQIKTGLPGMAYLRTTPTATWPAWLQPSAKLIEQARAETP